MMPALPQHSCQRRHRCATDANQMDMFLFPYHENFAVTRFGPGCSVCFIASSHSRHLTERVATPTGVVAGSRILRLDFVLFTSNAARTPIGNVTLPRDTCPERKP